MMQQDPKKDIQKPSVKEKLARYSEKKKVGVGEMGKPSLKAKFQSAMQKQYKSRPDIKPALKEDIKKAKAPSRKKYSLMMSMTKLD